MYGLFDEIRLWPVAQKRGIGPCATIVKCKSEAARRRCATIDASNLSPKPRGGGIIVYYYFCGTIIAGGWLPSTPGENGELLEFVNPEIALSEKDQIVCSAFFEFIPEEALGGTLQHYRSRLLED